MVHGKWFPQHSDIGVPLTLRRSVFGRGRDALDELAQQVVVYAEGRPVGAARLWWADGAFQLGEVGVPPEERKKGFGDLLVRMVLHKALCHHAGRLELTAPAEAAPFFARYGFAPTGESPPGGIRMALSPADISLCSCENACMPTPSTTR